MQIYVPVGMRWCISWYEYVCIIINVYWYMWMHVCSCMHVTWPVDMVSRGIALPLFPGSLYSNLYYKPLLWNKSNLWCLIHTRSCHESLPVGWEWWKNCRASRGFLPAFGHASSLLVSMIIAQSTCCWGRQQWSRKHAAVEMQSYHGDWKWCLVKNWSALSQLQQPLWRRKAPPGSYYLCCVLLSLHLQWECSKPDVYVCLCTCTLTLIVRRVSIASRINCHSYY